MPADQTHPHTSPDLDTDLDTGSAAATRASLVVALAVHDSPWPDPVEDYMRDVLPPVALLDRLTRRYASVPVPACRVCGGELEVQQMGGGEATIWAHSMPAGTSFSEWAEHYDGSRWVQRQHGDGDVLALVDIVTQLIAPTSADTNADPGPATP